jgi:hypothetical protein
VAIVLEMWCFLSRVKGFFFFLLHLFLNTMYKTLSLSMYHLSISSKTSLLLPPRRKWKNLIIDHNLFDKGQNALISWMLYHSFGQLNDGGKLSIVAPPVHEKRGAFLVRFMPLERRTFSMS